MSDSDDHSHRPIACDPSALDDPNAHERVGRELLTAHTGVRELEDGFGLRFPGFDSARTILEFVAGERQCCPFYRFDLVVEPADGPVWLQFRGDEEVKAYTADWIRRLRDEHEGDPASFAEDWRDE